MGLGGSETERDMDTKDMRTVGTPKLDDFAKLFCSEILPLLAVGDRAEAGGCSLEKVEHSNQVDYTTWLEFTHLDRNYGALCCYLDAERDRTGYVGGNLMDSYRGPSRKELLLFAEHAGALLAKLAEDLDPEDPDVVAAIAMIESQYAALKALKAVQA